MADRVGQQLGNYRLTRLLGRGGFADVYLGEHVHIDTLAAIKVLHAQLTSEDVEKFRTEARTLARLEHPHIVGLRDFGIQDNTPFLVMDYAPNGSLRQRYSRGTILPLTTIILYVTQVAEALQFAHDEKLIHRDIKPENIFLGRRNEVVLGDFGIAVLSRTTRSQSIEEITGTVAYMAEAYFYRGRAYFEIIKDQQAIADLDRAIQLDPDHAEVHFIRGLIHYELENYEQAIADYDHAIAIDTKYAEAYGHRGETYRVLNNYQRAIQDFDRAIQLDPKYAWAYGSRGQVYSSRKQYQQAIQDFDRALELDASLSWVKTEREEAYRMLKGQR